MSADKCHHHGVSAVWQLCTEVLGGGMGAEVGWTEEEEVTCSRFAM